MTRGTHVLGGITVALLGSFPVLPAIAGALFPDLDRRKGLPSRRTLFNSHRGILHHPVVPATVFLGGLLLKDLGFPEVSSYILSFSAGYCSHLFLDAFTPLGIPYKASYYPRFSIRIARSAVVEIFAILLMLYLLLVKGSAFDLATLVGDDTARVIKKFLKGV